VNERETRRVHVTIQAPGLGRQQLEALKGIIGRYPGSCKSFLHIVLPEELKTTINLPDSCKVAASEELSLEVKNLFGYNAVSFE
jgi:DNA polymerase-3 subunit alpha